MSSFQTVSRIQRIRNYADAHALYEKTKPIRGSDNVRPIGARRDAHRYNIVKGIGVYKAFLYNTPVVEFREGGETIIKTHGYNSALTMDFIAQVLGISAFRTRGQCVFTISGVKYVTSGYDGELVLRNSGYSYEVVAQQEHKHYVVSRAGANTVRRRYSEFRQYLKGFLSLRTQTFTFSSPYRGLDDIGRELVEVSMKELVDHLGVFTRDDAWGGNPRTNEYVDLKTVHGLTYKRADDYKPVNDYFDLLIQNGQSEEHRGANFYKACVMLAAKVAMDDHALSINTSREYVRVTPKSLEACLNEIQFKRFSDEVFVLADVPADKVPNHKYNSWVD